ncbi:hypothetical protein [Anaerocaecibacter muris]|uniref:hypothetical protein n=1 Tax=Anaerocaecibacter muris TaxID=2941513 RepID=UPI003F691548
MAKLMKADLNERDRNYLSTAFRTVNRLGAGRRTMPKIIVRVTPTKLKEAASGFLTTRSANHRAEKTLFAGCTNRAIAAYKNTDRNALNDAYE